MIIWITGLPGSGKTTLAVNLKSILETKVSNNIVILDGDNIRKMFPYKISYSNEDRRKLALFYSELALLIDQSDCIVICSFVALFHSVHEHTRVNANDYFEIFLDPPYCSKLRCTNITIFACEKSHHVFPPKKIHAFFDLLPLYFLGY